MRQGKAVSILAVGAMAGLLILAPNLAKAQQPPVIAHIACGSGNEINAIGCYIPAPRIFIMMGKGYTISTAILPGRVSFSLRNTNRQKITLSSGSPWVIKNSAGKMVYRPEAIQSTVELKKGDEYSWVWTGESRNGNSTPSGTYFARVPGLNGALVEFPWAQPTDTIFPN